MPLARRLAKASRGSWPVTMTDKRLSLTDCASFELMARLRLDSAFSFDRDFRDCGFQMVP
jgi:predicted nucleic acid-binding protein